MSLCVLKKRENAHISIYVHKNRVTTKEQKRNKIFSIVVCLNVLEMKLDLYAHEKMKQTNGRLFIGNNNNNNKDRKKRKTSLCIYCKKK